MSQTFEDWHRQNAKYMEPADLVPWCQEAWNAALAAATAEIEERLDHIEDDFDEGFQAALHGCLGDINSLIHKDNT